MPSCCNGPRGLTQYCDIGNGVVDHHQQAENPHQFVKLMSAGDETGKTVIDLHFVTTNSTSSSPLKHPSKPSGRFRLLKILVASRMALHWAKTLRLTPPLRAGPSKSRCLFFPPFW